MKVGSPRAPSSASIPSIPENARWVDDFAGPRDATVKDHATVLQGQVGFDNLNWELRQLTVQNGVESLVTTQKIRGVVQGAVLIGSELQSPITLVPRIISENKIGLTFVADPDPQDAYKVNVMVIGP